MRKNGNKGTDTFVIAVRQPRYFELLRTDIRKSPFSNRTDYFVALIEALQSIPCLFEHKRASEMSMLERLKVQSAFIQSIPLDRIRTLAQREHRSTDQMILYLIDVGIRCFPGIESFKSVHPNQHKLLHTKPQIQNHR